MYLESVLRLLAALACGLIAAAVSYFVFNLLVGGSTAYVLSISLAVMATLLFVWALR